MLKNSVALITGCGSGLGRATLKRFVKEGARVIGIDRNEETGSQIHNYGDDILFCKADTSDENQVQGVIKEIEDKHGHLDIVVNCAGLSNTFSLYNPNKWTIDKFELAVYLLNCNVIGTFNVCRLAVPLMSKNTPREFGDKGVIINSSGCIGAEGGVTQSFMSATLGAINSMTLPLSRDLADEGIRVVTVSPGIFDSPNISYWPSNVRRFFERLNLFPHRFGKEEEYADHVVGIINNKMLNGVVVRLNAGFRNHLCR